jgi:hypothetical protein
MKNYITLVVIMMLAGPALAGEETLLGGDLVSGGYGALVFKYGQVTGVDGLFVGAQGGWIINHTLVIGGGIYGLANQIESGSDECSYLGFGYGGLLLEFVVASNKLVHFTVQGILGAGGIGSYTDKGCDLCEDRGDDAFFALEPGANLMLNLHRHVRVGLGASYIYVSGVNYEDLTDSDFRTATAQFIIKFGSF